MILILALLPINDLIVCVSNIRRIGTIQEEREYLRNRQFTEVRGLVSIDAVTVHDSEHPEASDAAKVTLDAVAVLIDLSHLRNEASASLHGKLLDQVQLMHVQRTVASTIVVLAELIKLRQLFLLLIFDALISCLSSDVDVCEVRCL